MTYDEMTYTIRATSSAISMTTHARTLPCRTSEQIRLDVDRVDADERKITVKVEGDSYAISIFEERLNNQPLLEIDGCDVDTGGGEAQSEDGRLMEV